MTIEQRLAESRQLVGNHASLPLDRRRFVLDTLDAALNCIVTTGEVLAEREREIADLRNGVVVAPTEKRSSVAVHCRVEMDGAKVRDLVRAEFDREIAKFAEGLIEGTRRATESDALRDLPMPPIGPKGEE